MVHTLSFNDTVWRINIIRNYNLLQLLSNSMLRNAPMPCCVYATVESVETVTRAAA